MTTKKKAITMAKTKGKNLPWRKNQKVWTDTFYDKKLLRNPSLMTACELANALAEHQKWRRGEEKYDWHEEDPIKEGKEPDAPFSPSVLTALLYEAIVRLSMIGELCCGRHKSNVKI